MFLEAVGKVRDFSPLYEKVLGDAACFMLDKEYSLNNVTRLATTVKSMCKGSKYSMDKEHTSIVFTHIKMFVI
jgi:hypothetical protein